MKKFRIVIDAEFYAENIEDAFKKIGEHFTELYKGNLDHKLFTRGIVKIFPTIIEKEEKIYIEGVVK